MSLSFEESLKKNNIENNVATKRREIVEEVATMNIDDMSVAAPSIMTLDENSMIAAYSGDDGNWQQHSGYTHYGVFSDDNISVINETKDINLDGKQFNITQEENSQYIPFEMPRYYDGYDLVNTVISIHYTTKGGRHAGVKPVNVTFNDEKIRFGWLVDAGATLDVGTLEFEIHAYGTVTGSDGEAKAYTWKTKRNKSLIVLESMCDCEDTINDIDDTWVQDLVSSVAEKVAEQIAEAQVGTQVATAEAAAERAVAAASNAETTAQTVVSTALENYSTTSEIESYVKQQIANADIEGKLTEYAKTSEVESLIGDIGENVDVVSYVNNAVDSVDVTEQLKEYAKTEDVNAQIQNINNNITNNYYTSGQTEERISTSLESYATKDDVTGAIAEADISSKLENYYKKEETYSKDEIDTALDNVSVDLTGYATEKFVTDKTDALSSSVSDNADSITGINTAITTINQTLDSIDKSPKTKYRATYGDVQLDDGSTAEYMFTLWKEENGVEEVQDRFQIMGGGGSGGGSVTLRIAYVDGYTTPLVSTVDEKVIVKYDFSGEDSAGDTNLDGTASWKVGNRIVATEDVATGECEFDLTDYVTIGDNKVVLTITHATGAVATKAWTIKVVDVRLESTFDDTKVYTANESVVFTFTPYGGVNKTVHFLLDGEEIATKTSSAASAGLSDSYTISAKGHGAHLFEAYMTADINGKTVESNHIVKDIIWYDESSNVPVIGCVQQEFTARQYETTNITYTVYDPSTETPSVSLKSTYINEDGEVVEEYSSNITMSSNTATWQWKTDVIGEHTLTITCKDTVKVLKANVIEIGIDVSPITTGLVFDFNPVGYSNDDENRLWSSNNIAMTVSDNFDWVNGGYQIDENGDQCFCIKAGTSAEINYELFGDDAKSNGKQMKLIFRTENVSDSNTTFLSCVSDATGEGKNIGIEMKAQEATIYAKEDSLPLPYAEEEVIEFEFNITASSETIPMVMGYEDGVSTRPMVYDDTHDFQQYQGYRVPISLGSDDCDLYIYRFKVYNKSLSDRDILNNFIADARSAEEMIDRYDRNQIYKEGILDPDYLAEVCPDLRIIKLEVPHFTADKDDKVYNKNIQSIVECIYKNGDPIYDNWVAYDIVHSGQGTSSNNYGASGRNLDLILKSYKDYGNSPYIILGDGSQVSKVSLTRESIPTNYFNVKVNIASSENANNALLAKRYNQYNPYNRPFVREDESIIPHIKDTMEFQNCVIFLKESDPDLSTHVEFADNNWHYYAFGNIGDSKKTDDTRLTDPNDPYECIIEVMDNTMPLSTMPTGKTNPETGAPIYPISVEEWETMENPAYSALFYEVFDEEAGLNKDGSLNKPNGLDDTYGMRYVWEDGSDEENEAAWNYVKDKWREFYKFVVTSTDEEFKANLGDWVVLDSIMYYYLFTLRYTMTDNHAKNSFWHYGKSNDLDADGNPIRKWDLCFDYDNDTALGIDNYGRMTYRYGYEEVDYVDGTSDWVWNAPQHVFFLRLRELFDDELCELYTELESLGAWSATGLINQFNEWQSQFPEELWRVDIERKYIRTYTGSFINGEAKPEFLKERANGRKKTQRAQFEKNQEKYMSSKFGGTVASADDVILRCSVPNTTLAVEPNFDIKLTPYSHMYINVKYNTAPPVKMRAVPNQEYTVEYASDVADIIEIYSASCLKSIGDLSACYLINGDFSNAKKIRELVLGNDTEGYNNTNSMTLGLGSNELLNKLDIQNMSGLSSSLDLSGLKNLKELYALGSSVSGVIFADGGNIEIAEIPAVGSLSMKNLNYLTDDGMEVESYNSLTKLVAENSLLDLLSIINNSPNLYQVRLTGINWTLDSTDLLARLYNLAGVTNTGANSDQSVLSGSVTVPTIGQYELYKYEEAWSDLTIIPKDGIIPQYKVTFRNYDGTELDVQYIDQYGSAVEPITREENPIATPTKESSIQYSYAYSGWDTDFSNIVMDIDVYATYKESLREYTIQYVSMGTPVKTATGLYGDNIVYDGTIPTYTAAEPTAFYLFNRWDKSGLLTGDFDSNGVKTVTAVFDKFTGNSTYFSDKELSDLTPVEIYAMTKLGVSEDVITDKDPYSFVIGNDVDYDDIESELLISEKTSFTGSNYVDTGIQLFDEDKDFVLAIDYEFLSGNSSNAVLAQCFQFNGTNGFKLWYNGGATFTWGTSSDSNISDVDSREILVIRHKKGDNNLTIYKSNLDGDEVLTVDLARTKSTIGTGTLVFGCAKADDGIYENYAVGNIHWAKLWYADLGDDVCQDLAMWTHESITLEACGFRKYYLTENTSKRCSFSLLASHLLGRVKRWNISNTNDGGWDKSELNKSLNTRLYNAMPTQIKVLLKQVIVYSNDGLTNNSVTPVQQYTEVTPSNCYITIPSLIEVDPTQTSEPYNSEGTTISYLNNNVSRQRAFDNGEYNAYWLRSPAPIIYNTTYPNYIWRVDAEGYTQGITNAQTELGVLIMISF